ncbi:hypothetical protein F4808DRAFT_437193 [Astrocystis sublimbata]|nr:hypothetical protein F4808DRAFT_437193 [Astrocystis sublimbata]
MADHSKPPMYTDHPLTLIPTPKFQTSKDDPFTIEASHMALSHNAFIRGFNSIYQQGPRLKLDTDKSDFVGYSLSWVDCVVAHHHYEETELFPNIDRAAGRKGLMDDATHEHEAFYGGMDRMKKYLQRKGADFSSNELLEIMDSFKDALHSHLKAEPPAIVALAQYSTAENPIDILGIAGTAGKKQVNLSFLFNTLPVFLLNMETATFEDGMWHGVFPPFEGVLRMIMMRVIPLWQSQRWRFVSCAHDGRVKSLAI